MTKLKYVPHPAADKDRLDSIRRTRTVCIHASNRPKGIYSKNLVRLLVSADGSDQPLVKGVFCVDAAGSKMGHLIGHEAHFKGIAGGSELTVEITPATPHDCAEWLEGNEDPERKSLGQILSFALQGAEETGRLAQMSEENFNAARQDRKSAAQDKKKGILYGIAGFLGGIIFDVGMLEEKLGLEIPLELILALFALTILATVVAFRLIGSTPPHEMPAPPENESRSS